MVVLTVEPREVLVDDDVRVRVTGLRPCQSVVVRARTCDDANAWWESSAELRADDHGEVNPARQRALAGSYIGVEPMGLFWSMTPTTGGSHPPLFNWRRREPSRVTLTVEADGAALAEAVLDRRFISPEVVEHQVRRDGPHGRLFVPPGPGPHPAVLVFGGSGGGLMWAEELAPILASRGFVALALAYFAYPGLPALLQDIPLEYFEGAIAWLRARENVQDEPVAVIGMSMGGQLALILGAAFPDAVGAVGGARREHALADVDSWRRTLGFLRKHIGNGDHAH